MDVSLRDVDCGLASAAVIAATFLIIVSARSDAAAAAVIAVAARARLGNKSPTTCGRKDSKEEET